MLPAGFACGLETPPRGALDMLLPAMSVMLAQRLYVEIELYRERAHVVVLPPPCPQHVQPIDFSHAGELIDRALADSRTVLDGLGASPSPTERLRPHSHETREPFGAQSRSEVLTVPKPTAVRESR